MAVQGQEALHGIQSFGLKTERRVRAVDCFRLPHVL